MTPTRTRTLNRLIKSQLVVGQAGVLRSRAVEDQAHQASSLRLLATAIIVWNAVYMSEAVERLREAKYEVDEALSQMPFRL